jgi:hypothetical protein
VNPIAKYLLRAFLTAFSAFLIGRFVNALDRRVAANRA